MINFFRKTRKKLADNNQFLKYSRYAIGEILLVVIGILIALQVNNWNEMSQKEARIETIMGEVLLDLQSNINLTNRFLLYYSHKDSLNRLVLNNQVSYEDYVTDKIGRDLRRLTINSAAGEMKQSAYDNLLLEQSSISREYTSIMDKLKGLNSGEKRSIDKYRDLVEDLSNRNIQKRADNYEWYSNFDRDNEDRINFMLNDYHYRNEVLYCHTMSITYVRFIANYNKLARRCYEEIATLLNKPIDFKLKNFPEVTKSLVGTWESEQEPGVINKHYIDDDRLFFLDNRGSRTREIIIMSNSKFLITTSNFCTILKEGDDIIVKTNRGSIWRKVKE